jgi:YbgC/YbaW family acyl-CoA thioester hydrolase
MTEQIERMRVNWIDTDASGLIHYTAALRYFEVAEHALMRKLLPIRPSLDGMVSLPRVHVEADYKGPLRYADEFECVARVAAIGRSSVTFAYEIRRLDGTLCVVGRIVAAAVDSAGQVIALPAEFRVALAAAL